jgi:DNA modification methylase
LSFYKRKEVIGNATLYLGDCLPVMAQFKNQEIDAVVTDPPYGIGVCSSGVVGGGEKGRGDARATVTDFSPTEWDRKTPTLKYFIQIKRIATHQVIFGGNYFPVEPSSCWLVWDKCNAGTKFADCELAWTNLKTAVRKIKYRWNGMLQENMKDKEVRVHPTQKPVKVMEWCIEQIPLRPGSLIIDPFMGSGTTGIAATNLGHKFIGVEMDEEYFDIACNRIEQAQRQGKLFA